MTKTRSLTLQWMLLLGLAITQAAAQESPTKLRPPSVPLVAVDPYFSIWSPADNLYDADTTHWTGRPHRLTSLVRIDGKAFRLMGASPTQLAPLPQTSLEVLPTRTLYTFQGAGIELALTFTTPALPADMDVLSRPVTYLEWAAKSLDGKKHAVEIYFDAAAELTVNEPSQQVVWARENVGELVALKIGSKDQPILAKKGDDLRIDWGYLYTAAVAGQVKANVIAGASATRTAFVQDGSLPAEIEARQPRAASDDTPVAAMTFHLGKVGAKAARQMLLLAYDDLWSIQ
ncbi:MAG TPA: DUF5127 domain-containing protein, partial [Bacillota bacterium]|nr:DUF5127 domain-containing protein [Bacillota bacterium]